MMMKMNKIYKLLVISMFVVLTACSDWLHIEPQNALIGDEFWKTREDVEGVVASCYLGLRDITDECFVYGELRGDLAEIGEGITDDAEDLMKGNIYNGNNLFKWGDFYTTINYANSVIMLGPKARETDYSFTERELKALQAEAVYVRSLCYFYLVRSFRDVPYVTEPSISDSQEFWLPKTDGKVILRNLIQDLKQSELYILSSYDGSEYNKGRATRAAIQALMAEIFLWQEDYDNCIIYCDKIIAQGRYNILQSHNWFRLFFPGNSNESIFEIQYDASLEQTNKFFPMFGAEKADYIASEIAIEKFGEHGDIRGHLKTYEEETSRIWKYVGRSTSGAEAYIGNASQSDANWIVHRLADIHLIKAEALIASNRLGEAVEEINVIRQRAGLEIIYDVYSKDDLELLLLEERAAEFAFEGKRWFDLLRFAQRNDFERKVEFIEMITAKFSAQIRPDMMAKYSDPNSWYFPIHIDELDANPELEQNPYYLN